MFLTLTTKFHFISPSSGFLRQQVLWQNHMSHISIIQCNITWVIDGVCHGVKLLVVSVNPWKNIKSQSLSSGSSTLILKQDTPCLHLPCGTATPATPSLPLLYSQRESQGPNGGWSLHQDWRSLLDVVKILWTRSVAPTEPLCLKMSRMNENLQARNSGWNES